MRRILIAAACLALSAGISRAQSFYENTGSGGAGAAAAGVGTDASANPPSLAGLNLLGTLAANPGRLGYLVQTQDTAANCGGSALAVVLDDGAGNNLTVYYLSYPTARGSQGAALDMGGFPFAGRIRYYGTSGCQVGAHQTP